MEANPETKFSALVNKINELLPPQTLNEFVLQKLKREAKTLLSIDASSSYIAQGMISCLETDVESLNIFYSKALKLADNDDVRQNYGSSLNNVGFYSEALTQYEIAYQTVKDDLSLVKTLLESAISSFHFKRANELFHDVIRMQPESENDYVAQHAYQMMKKFDISDDDTLPVRIAYSKVIEKGYRIWGAEIMLCEEDGFEWLDMDFKVSAPLDTVVEMNFNFADLIVEDAEEGVLNHLVVRFSEHRHVD